MTFDESKKILFTISVTYPNFKPQADPDDVAKVWAAMLSEYPYQIVSAALKAFIKSDSGGFAPTIGQIVQLIEKKKDDAEMNAEEAWSLVRKAIGRGGYNAEEEYDKLPALVQKAIGSPGNIHELSQTDTGTVESVEKSHFIRTYNTLVDREMQRRKIPEDAQKVLGMAAPEKKYIAVNDTKQIEEKHEGTPMPEWARKEIDELIGGMED